MEEEPLLPYLGPRKRIPQPPLPLCTLPEDDEISLPLPLTPSELKDRLIFGPSSASPRDPSPLVEALTLSLNSPRPSSSNQDFNTFLDSPQLQQHQQQQQQSCLVDLYYPSTKAHLHRSKTAPAMSVTNDFNQPVITKPKLGSQPVIRQAFVFLVLYLSLGVLIYSLNRDKFEGIETHPVVDALYFCIVTMCTIGYGDITPNSTSTKLFSILFVLVGFGFIDILLSGMVGYVLDLQESHLLRNVKRGAEKKSAGSYIIDVKKGRMRIRMKVGFALGVVVLCIGVGAGAMHFVESLGWLDSLYLSVMSVTTVGYGDRAFNSLAGRVFASIWLLVSTLAVARAFLYFAEARVDKRQRMMAKWVLGQHMTASEFLAADIDNDGSVSKSEYAIYKLKEMGKVSEKDIMQICEQFERLDTGNCGKITLADLRESHP
ncbi:two-pore potassium channel [Salix suchowensis]|nr:two-pore potassium channel [Salix suchowensis]